MPGNIGPLEIAIVVIIALLVFGPKRLPELGRSLGKGIREFKGSVSGDSREEDEESRSLERGEGEDPPAATPREAEVARDERS